MALIKGLVLTGALTTGGFSHLGCGAPRPANIPAQAGVVEQGWNGYATAQRCAPAGVHVRLHMLAISLAGMLNDAGAAKIRAISLDGTSGALSASLDQAALNTLLNSIAPLELVTLGHPALAKQLANVSSRLTRRQKLQVVAAVAIEADKLDQDLDRHSESLLMILERLEGQPAVRLDDKCYELGELGGDESHAIDILISAGVAPDIIADRASTLLASMAQAARVSARQRR
jgi:hypothetical protein